MKKLLFIALFLVYFSNGYSQLQIGGQIGGNIGYQRTTISMASENTTKVAGMVFGLVAEATLKNKWSFRPELNYIQKGFSIKNKINNLDYRGSLYYIEVPMNFTYNMKVTNGTVYIGAGPSIAYGAYGKISDGSNTNYVKFDGKDEENHYKKFDFGINFLLGYKFNSGSFFNIGYNNGLTDIDTNIGDNAETRNKGFLIKFGYMLKKKK